MTYISDTSQVTSVWSQYGHRFMGDGEGIESCLTCGAVYDFMALADDPTRGEYLPTPHQCTGDTNMVHGYPGEREAGLNYGCNCLLCN
jgi:hypothetical protein